MTMDDRKEMHKKLMLSMMKLIAGCEVKSSCALLKSKAERKVMLKKRWNHRPLVKVRWHGVKREERVCKECDSRELEDKCIWLLQCSALDHLSHFWKQEKTIQGRAIEMEQFWCLIFLSSYSYNLYWSTWCSSSYLPH